MSVEIFINDKKLDTYVSTTISETKQINDFLDFSSKQTSYTNSFKIPKTENNKNIFGLLGMENNTSISAYRLHKAQIYRDGIPTVTDGTAYLKDTDDNYNLYIYSENIDLFDKLADKKISDLNLQEINHDLNIDNWINAFQNENYTYAIADYGKTDRDIIEIDYQSPAIYIKYIWNKIFNESGFDYKYIGRAGQEDFNPFITEEWKELAITLDEGFAEKKDAINPELKLKLKKYELVELKGETKNFFGHEIVVQELTGEVNNYIQFSTEFDIDGIHVITQSTQYKRSRIRIKEDGFYRIDSSGIFNNNQTEESHIVIEKDGGTFLTIKEDLDEGQSQFSFSQRVYLRQNDELFVKVRSIAKDGLCNYAYEINFDVYLDNTIQTVNFSSYLTKIKQSEFIIDVCNYFGLIFRRKQKTYEFISLNELLDSRSVYSKKISEEFILEDWSDKFHRVVSESSKIGNYAKSNLLKYKYDNSEDTYANSVIKIDDETLENETTIIERPYRAPDRSLIEINNERLLYCKLYEKEYNDDGTLKNVKPQKVEPYFIRVKKVNGDLKYKIYNSPTYNTFSGSFTIATFDGLDFNNVVPNRYGAFVNMLNYGKKITAELLLNPIDINSLNFFKLKYIKQLGHLFYLNKVSNYIGGEKTKCELIQLRTVEKLGEFSKDFNQDFN